MSHESPETKHESPVRKMKMPTSKLLVLGMLGGLAVALIAVGGIGYTMAKKGSESAFAQSTARFFGLSVATVNGDKISYADYKEDLATLTKFYAKMAGTQPTPSEEELSQQVLSRQMINVLMRQIAAELAVSVDEADVEAAKEQMVTQLGSLEAAEQELSENYGWTMNAYINKVVRPILLEQAVVAAFQSSEDEAHKAFELNDEVKGSHILFKVEDESVRKEVKKLAEDVLSRIKKGESFEELAKQYGGDGTKEQGGDLGWFSSGVMVKPFEDAIFALKDDQLSDSLVETEFGYHIIKRTGSRKGKDFNAFMTDKIKNASIVMRMNVPNPLEDMFTEELAEPAVVAE